METGVTGGYGLAFALHYRGIDGSNSEGGDACYYGACTVEAGEALAGGYPCAIGIGMDEMVLCECELPLDGRELEAYRSWLSGFSKLAA